jgi:hypothetical protein
MNGGMSASGSAGRELPFHVRYGGKADMAWTSRNVRL